MWKCMEAEDMAFFKDPVCVFTLPMGDQIVLSEVQVFWWGCDSLGF